MTPANSTTSSRPDADRFTEEELTALRPLQQQFPNLDAALAEIARLSAERSLVKGTVHVISDIHGEDGKLRHVINNASGMLRPQVEQHFANRLRAEELRELLALLFYPRETMDRLEPQAERELPERSGARLAGEARYERSQRGQGDAERELPERSGARLAGEARYERSQRGQGDAERELPERSGARLAGEARYERSQRGQGDAERKLLHARQEFYRKVLGWLFELVRVLAPRYPLRQAVQLFPIEYRDLFQELLLRPVPAFAAPQGADLPDDAIDSLVRHDHGAEVTRKVVRVVRNLAVEELVIAGDCWDRGPRGDRVVDYLQRQPNLSFTWGNHDVSWLGACLGHEALIACVLRISARYRRLSQLEEGYGITLQPLEHLIRNVYSEDPALCYLPRGSGLRDVDTVARIQKAAAVMQFKLEGQLLARNPQWGLENRRLLHRMNVQAGTVEVDGTQHKLRDRFFPTIDPANPYALSEEEQVCMRRLRQSFLASQKLWEHMQFLIHHGLMYVRRDDNLIFHGCVPVDEQGEFLPFEVHGQPYKGKALFEALDGVLARILDHPSQADLDLLWYLWCGPRSPLFGKDRIATFEIDIVEDVATHKETKNPYFQLIHEPAFCDRIFREFGVNPTRGLIVNGHVPVKIETGESPLKRSGKAITIDGAFSEAYGDHGYTLVLECSRTLLARHHHFESVEAAVRDGVDIIPQVSEVRTWDPPRKVADTERGREIGRALGWLEMLVQAYQGNQLRQRKDEG